MTAMMATVRIPLMLLKLNSSKTKSLLLTKAEKLAFLITAITMIGTAIKARIQEYEQTQLKINRLLTLLVDVFRLIFICTPYDDWKNQISKRNKILGQCA